MSNWDTVIACWFIYGHFWTRTESRGVDRLCVMLSLHWTVAQGTVNHSQAVTAPWFPSHPLTSDILFHCFITSVSVPSCWYFKIPRAGEQIRNRNWFLTVGRYRVCRGSSLCSETAPCCCVHPWRQRAGVCPLPPIPSVRVPRNAC